MAASPYVPHFPTSRQAAFLVAPESEILYGGAAGGGKSDALLMAALEYVHVPGYAALLLRRSYSDLSLPGAIMDRAGAWLRPTDARWNDTTKTWAFPSGASVTFGYLQTEQDKYRYQSAEFQFVGFDELTQFTEKMYRYLFSRLRRLIGSHVPIRMRAASNPGGIGHEWVRARFMDEAKPTRRFIPAKLADNPHLDEDEYTQSLMELDPVTRQQLLRGDWTARQPGGWFKREKWQTVDAIPRIKSAVRAWDLAATEAKAGKDPDWTVGVKLAPIEGGGYCVLDVVRFREGPGQSERIIRATAELDGQSVVVYMEQEPGASGKIAVSYYRRQVLRGFTMRAEVASGNKGLRAGPWATAVDDGTVQLVRGSWNNAYVDEHEAFPTAGVHDDQIDASSLAHSKLATGQGGAFMEAWGQMAEKAAAAANGEQPTELPAETEEREQ